MSLSEMDTYVRLFGYDQGVMSGLLTGTAFTTQFPEIGELRAELHLRLTTDTTSTGTGSASLQGTVVAIYEIGCLFGSIFTFFMGERFGRRRTIMLGCSVLIVGATLQTTSYGIPQMIVGRIVTGLGNGINTSTVPVWHSETTQAEDRGRALAIELAINIFGVVSWNNCPRSTRFLMDANLILLDVRLLD
jgi:MFS family permease